MHTTCYPLPFAPMIMETRKVSVDEVLCTVQILYYYVYYSKLLMAQVHNAL